MYHLADVLIDAFPSYYVKNLFRHNTLKDFAMQLVLQQSLPHLDSGNWHKTCSAVNNFSVLPDMMSDMCSICARLPVFLSDMLFITVRYSSLYILHKLIVKIFFISFGYTQQVIRMYPYTKMDLGPLQHHWGSSLWQQLTTG